MACMEAFSPRRFKCKEEEMKFPSTPQLAGIRSKTHHLGVTASKTPHWFPLLHPATGDETDSSHISAQLDGVFIITTQQGSDRGRKQQRERWRSGGRSGGGGIKAGGRRGEVGGRMNRRKKGVGCCVVLRERAVPCCRGVCLCFFYMNASVTVHVFFFNVDTTNWRSS